LQLAATVAILRYVGNSQDKQSTRSLRVGVAGLQRRYMDLLPALYRTEGLEVAWVVTAGDSTLERLCDLFEFPVKGDDAGALPPVDVAVLGHRGESVGAILARATLSAEVVSGLVKGGRIDVEALWDAAGLPREEEASAAEQEPRREDLEGGGAASDEGEIQQGNPSANAVQPWPDEAPAWLAKASDLASLADWIVATIKQEAGLSDCRLFAPDAGMRRLIPEGGISDGDLAARDRDAQSESWVSVELPGADGIRILGTRDGADENEIRKRISEAARKVAAAGPLLAKLWWGQSALELLESIRKLLARWDRKVD